MCVCRCVCVCTVPGLWKVSLVLKTVVKKPNGKAPIPNDMWNPVSPNPWKGWRRKKQDEEVKEDRWD